MRRWGWVLLVATLVSTAYLGCSPSTDSGPPVTGYDRTTPDNLMKFFAHAYREKELDDYEEALDEDFLFQFTSEIADELGLPPDEPWWGKTEDVSSTNGLFESPTVTDITFTYEDVGAWEAVNDVRPDTTFSGLFRRLDPVIEVTTLVEEEDPIKKLRVDGSWLDVTVVPDRYAEGLWTILKIQEIEKNPGP